VPDITEPMQQPDAERFAALFDTHRRTVLAYALRRVDDPADAADAVAETFLIAWRRFDDVPEDALPWLFAVARRVLANQRRSASRGKALELRLASAAGGAEPGPQDSAGETEAVLVALASLPDRDREALTLVAWHGLSGARAARAAGCSRTAFGVRLHRARRRLAARLASPEPAAANTESLEAS
jgi:RNA polymerase sigma-70 factor (ECF subfamily)